MHVVALFPKEKCSCPSTSTCYHVLAAKLFIVAECKPTNQVLTELRRNVRRKKEKKEVVSVLDQMTLMRLMMKVRVNQ